MYTARNHARLRICSAFLIASLLLSLSGCLSVGPDYTKPTLNLPANWVEANSALPGSSQDGLRMWWQSFNDPAARQVGRAGAGAESGYWYRTGAVAAGARGAGSDRVGLWADNFGAEGLERRGAPARPSPGKSAASRGRGLLALTRVGSWIFLVERAGRLKRQMRALKRSPKIIAHCR